VCTAAKVMAQAVAMEVVCATITNGAVTENIISTRLTACAHGNGNGVSISFLHSMLNSGTARTGQHCTGAALCHKLSQNGRAEPGNAQMCRSMEVRRVHSNAAQAGAGLLTPDR
jgi:hypothetical protein